jgi:hypothetical protein
VVAIVTVSKFLETLRLIFPARVNFSEIDIPLLGVGASEELAVALAVTIGDGKMDGSIKLEVPKVIILLRTKLL